MVRFRCLSQGRKSQNWGRRSLERKGRRGGSGIGGMGVGAGAEETRKGKQTIWGIITKQYSVRINCKKKKKQTSLTS